MRRQDAEGRTVQGAGHEEWALPDARRRQHGAAHQYGFDPFKARELETRLLFGTLETPGEAAAQVAARVQGTVPRYCGPNGSVREGGMTHVA